MPVCEVCGGDERAFQVVLEKTAHVFDSFDCALHALVPPGENCACLRHRGQAQQRSRRDRIAAFRPEAGPKGLLAT
jgi:hypothetical protein